MAEVATARQRALTRYDLSELHSTEELREVVPLLSGYITKIKQIMQNPQSPLRWVVEAMFTEQETGRWVPWTGQTRGFVLVREWVIAHDVAAGLVLDGPSLRVVFQRQKDGLYVLRAEAEA